MLDLVLIDRSAQSRQQLYDRISALLASDLPEIELLPRINVSTASLNELSFKKSADICIVGQDIVLNELTEISEIRKALPNATLLAALPERASSLALVEQLVRLGADEMLPASTSPAEFLQKLMILARRASRAKPGKLILVDSGKGGVGVTTVAAALSDALESTGKRVCLVDLDFESQDLSRFLLARPFINENLEQILRQTRLASSEFVEEAIRPLDRRKNFYLMCPPPETEALWDPRSHYTRGLLSVLEVLDTSFDCVVVDLAAARGPLLQALYQVADKVVFVVNGDPATFHASGQKISRYRSFMSPQAQFVVLENGSWHEEVSNSYLVNEFQKSITLRPQEWASRVAFCRTGGAWPASGGTFYSMGSRKASAAVMELVQTLGLAEVEQRVSLTERCKAMLGELKRPRTKHLSEGPTKGIETRAPLQLPSDAKPSLPQPVIANQKSLPLYDGEGSFFETKILPVTEALPQPAEEPELDESQFFKTAIN